MSLSERSLVHAPFQTQGHDDYLAPIEDTPVQLPSQDYIPQNRFFSLSRRHRSPLSLLRRKATHITENVSSWMKDRLPPEETKDDGPFFMIAQLLLSGKNFSVPQDTMIQFVFDHEGNAQPLFDAWPYKRRKRIHYGLGQHLSHAIQAKFQDFTNAYVVPFTKLAEKRIDQENDAFHQTIDSIKKKWALRRIAF